MENASIIQNDPAAPSALPNPVTVDQTTTTDVSSSVPDESLFSIDTAVSFVNEPIELGDIKFTLTGLATAFVIFVLFLILSALIQRTVGPWLDRRLHRSLGVAYAIRRFIHYFIVLVGLLIAAQMVGLDLSSFAIILGFLSVGIGFGLQNITSNFISGLILLIERPISVGDLVSAGDRIGRVKEIKMRSTVIVTLGNITIIVPNSQFIENDVVNWSHGDPRIRIHVPVGVAYGSDLNIVKGSLLNVAKGHESVLESPAPEVRFLEFGDSSLNFELLVWIDQPSEKFIIQSQLNFGIDAAFRQAGISIPFPQRDINLQMTRAVDRLAEREKK